MALAVLHVCVILHLAGGFVSAAQEPPLPAPAPVETRSTPPAAVPDATPVRLYMPDGQLKSRRLAVYVTATIHESQHPRLELFRGHAVTTADPKEADPLTPAFVASGQQWTETIDGRAVNQTGTILLFDGSRMPLTWKAMVRVRPALRWTEAGVERVVLGPEEVNVGDIVFAVMWTVAVVGIALVIVLILAWRRESPPILLLTGVDGHLSLAQLQVACWTIFVGSVVLGYGLIRLEIPQIPESLVVLMGASLVTGGVAYFQDAKKDRAAVDVGLPTQRRWQWGDLVRVFTPGQLPELSLAKAQMLFWTVLLLVLFVSKSILEGVIWEVPWPLVALMGFSQAGYLATKAVPATAPQDSAPLPPAPVPLLVITPPGAAAAVPPAGQAAGTL